MYAIEDLVILGKQGWRCFPCAQITEDCGGLALDVVQGGFKVFELREEDVFP